jgi:hypothetical protein
VLRSDAVAGREATEIRELVREWQVANPSAIVSFED